MICNTCISYVVFGPPEFLSVWPITSILQITLSEMVLIQLMSLLILQLEPLTLVLTVGLVTNFAVLAGNNLQDLPPDFTICSLTTNKAFMSTIQPLQLLHSDGKSWISVIFGLTPKNKKILISP